MLIGPEKSLADEQSHMNQSTRGQWDWYASHRKHIEQLIIPRRRGERICVLGAGNCNDVDLKWMIDAYAEVHLVDIDPASLRRAVERQGVMENGRLKLHAPIDLTGIAERTIGWRGRKVADAEMSEAITLCINGATALAEQFDVVLSPCVLSQLLCGVRALAGKQHPRWPALKTALRARHLREISSLIAPGGRGVLVIDLSSTSAITGLDQARSEDLESLMRLAARDGKCFKGLEPAEIVAAIRNDTDLRPIAQGLTVSPPWLWHLGFGSAFLVYAMTLTKTRS